MPRTVTMPATVPRIVVPMTVVTAMRGGRVAVRNPAFDVTPAELVTGIVCERGVILRPTREKIQGMMSTGV